MEFFVTIWGLVAIIAASFVVGGLLYSSNHKGLGAFYVLPIVAIVHFGGWYDLATLATKEGLPFWGGLFVYALCALVYGVWDSRVEIERNVRKRIDAQRDWFLRHGLVYEAQGKRIIPPHLKEDYGRWVERQPAFDRKHVEGWYANNKLPLFYVVWFMPVHVLLNIGEHLKELLLVILESRIVRYPFRWISSMYYDELDLKLRDIITAAVPSDTTSS